jgi:hypothetical protein
MGCDLAVWALTLVVVTVPAVVAAFHGGFARGHQVAGDIFAFPGLYGVYSVDC